MKPLSELPRPAASGRSALGWWLLGCVLQAWGCETLLESEVSSSACWSSIGWQSVVRSLGGEMTDSDGASMAEVPFLSLLGIVVMLSLVGFAAVKGLLLRRWDVRPGDWLNAISRGGRWWCLSGVWVLLGLLSFVAGLESLTALVALNGHWAIGLSVAGWLAELAGLVGADDSDTPPLGLPQGRSEGGSISKTVWLAMLVYVVVFTTMNWQLYWNLMLPHGDSSMYEEHLWNLTHGKGFRSYLDQGLFLGEHVQVVHLGLLPAYWLWPSHLMLELCQSLALASGAAPVFWLARRASGSARAASLLAVAYLLYPPMQFLDIAIDFKTFRPSAFGIPAILFALDQFERGRIKSMLLCCVVALASQEDFALVLGPLGLWIALRPMLGNWLSEETDRLPPTMRDKRRAAIFGGGLLLGSIAYFLTATRIVIPWFRDGEELHYVRYFAKFGEGFGEVVLNMLLKPGLLFSELCSIPACLYLLAVFVPLACLPFLSPTRLAVAAPLLVLLCLNEVVRSDPFPRHHFQAVIVPLLFWAAAGALTTGRVGRARLLPNRDSRLGGSLALPIAALPMATLVCAASFMGSVTSAQNPLSLRFWDAGSVAYWRANYVVSRRAELFERVLAVIPLTARVASTDFVHPRFTHHERSYDYSHYPRRVANYEDRVPDDTDFIVIDTGHRYSDIKQPQQLRELQREPEKWEVLDIPTEGYFIVVKRR